MSYSIKTDKMSYVFSEVGAELLSAKSLSGGEYIWQGAEGCWSGHAPVLFPLCGRVKDNKYTYGGKEYTLGCHGIFPSSVPTLTYSDESTLCFLLTESESTLSVYPFPFKMTLKYTAKDNKLCVDATVTNTGRDELPFMYGGHPALSLSINEGLKNEDYFIDFGQSEIYLQGQVTPDVPFVNKTGDKIQLEPSGFRINEDEIARLGTAIFSELSGYVKLYAEGAPHSVEIEFSKDFKYFCLWKMKGEAEKYICLEPWSGIPSDGTTPEEFETRASMVRLSPGESADFSYTIRFN